jgi:hypothetical protein
VAFRAQATHFARFPVVSTRGMQELGAGVAIGGLDQIEDRRARSDRGTGGR